MSRITHPVGCHTSTCCTIAPAIGRSNPIDGPGLRVCLRVSHAPRGARAPPHAQSRRPPATVPPAAAARTAAPTRAGPPARRRGRAGWCPGDLDQAAPGVTCDEVAASGWLGCGRPAAEKGALTEVAGHEE